MVSLQLYGKTRLDISSSPATRLTQGKGQQLSLRPVHGYRKSLAVLVVVFRIKSSCYRKKMPEIAVTLLRCLFFSYKRSLAVSCYVVWHRHFFILSILLHGSKWLLESQPSFPHLKQQERGRIEERHIFFLLRRLPSSPK